MFKIGKLQDVKDEKVNIKLVTQEHNSFNNGKIHKNVFKTLSFDISGKDYNFGFDLNCKLEKLLEIPMNETKDFNNYIFGGETWLNINGLNGFEPTMDIKITRYLRSKFIIYLTFYAYGLDDDTYSGMIEFDFNLDDYL